jgi:hypothetical protein
MLAAIVPGACHEYLTEADVAAWILDGIERPAGAAADIGVALERAVLRYAARRYGWRVVGCTWTYTAGALAASPDAWIVGEPAFAEVKVTSERVDEPTDRWYWQAIAQLATSDVERVELVALAGLALRRWTIRRADVAGDVVRARILADTFAAEVAAGWLPEIPPRLVLSLRTLPAGTIEAMPASPLHEAGEAMAAAAAARLAADKREAMARDALALAMADAGATEAIAPAWVATVTRKAPDKPAALAFRRRGPRTGGSADDDAD